jgi:hypothetical protein
LLKLLFEVGLVSLGVFLALIAGQWRDTREHRAQANATLRYFRDDLVANQHAILAERAYHESLMREVDGYLNSPEPKTTQSFDASVHFKGIHPIIFERTAWDLAVGNQTLSNLDPSLAYAISRVYTRQQEFQTMENGFMQAAFAPTSFTTQDPTGFVTALSVYMHDVNIEEPSLLKSYEQLLPQIDAAVPRKQP